MTDETDKIAKAGMQHVVLGQLGVPTDGQNRVAERNGGWGEATVGGIDCFWCSAVSPPFVGRPYSDVFFGDASPKGGHEVIQSIQWSGDNSQEIASSVSGRDDLAAKELTPEVSLRQRDGSFFLTLPARHGEVWLSKGDWAVQETDGFWVRLSPQQYTEEYAKDVD